MAHTSLLRKAIELTLIGALGWSLLSSSPLVQNAKESIQYAKENDPESLRLLKQEFVDEPLSELKESTTREMKSRLKENLPGFDAIQDILEAMPSKEQIDREGFARALDNNILANDAKKAAQAESESMDLTR